MPVDMAKPLVWQMWGLSKAEYLHWVHEPHSYAPGEAPLFEWSFLEPLTRTVWWVIPCVWLPAAAWMAAPWAASVGFALAPCVAMLVGGLLLWTLVEYVIHRFLFHADEAVPDAGAALVLHFLLHGIHHKVPMDRYRLVMPPALFAALAASVYALTTPLIAGALGVPRPMWNALYGAVIAGYVCYDMVHYGQHHAHLARASYLGQMKAYHMKHHFSGQQGVGFGITTKFWDRVFGTLLDVNKKASEEEVKQMNAIDGGDKTQ